MIRTTLAIAAFAGVASGQSFIVNGGFEDGPTGWNFFNSGSFQDASDPMSDADPSGLLDNNTLKTFGVFSGGENFSGAAQDLVGWDFGDTISFGAQAYTASSDSIAGSANEAFVAINAFDAFGNFLFNVPSVERITGASTPDEVTMLVNDFTVTEDLRGLLARLELVLVFRQPAGVFDGGAVWFDNAFAVPAPGSMALLGLGGLAAARRRR